MPYTVETFSNKGWQVWLETESYSVAMETFTSLHKEDPFGVRLTCEPVYHAEVA